MSGLEQVRFIHDGDTDTPIVTREDFVEVSAIALVRRKILAVTAEQKQFFILKSQLAQLGMVGHLVHRCL
jgi:hypothetical protein